MYLLHTSFRPIRSSSLSDVLWNKSLFSHYICFRLLKRSPKKLKMLAKSPLKVARPPLAFLENDAREKAHGADPFIKPHIPIQRHMQDAHKLRKSSIRKRFEGRGNNRGISEQPFRLKHENNLTIFEVQEVWKESVASR